GQSDAAARRKKLEARQGGLEALRDEQAEVHKQLRKTERDLEAARQDLHRSSGRLESLIALQRAADEGEDARAWLDKQGLESAPRLVESIEVAEGWETAVETVLGHWLQSVMVDGLDVDPKALTSIEEGALTLMDLARGPEKGFSGSLAAHVDGPQAVRSLLRPIATCGSIKDAMARRAKLEDGESIITPEGVWLSRDWIRIARGLGDSSGVLLREKEISELRAHCGALEDDVGKLDETLQAALQRRDALEASVREAQAEVNDLHREVAGLEASHDSRQASLEMMSGRGAEIAKEMSALTKQIEADRKSVAEARAEQEKQVEAMAELRAERESLEGQRKSLIEARDTARKAFREASDKRQALALKAHAHEASLESLHQSLERMNTRVSQLQQRYLSLSEERAGRAAPEAQFKDEMAALLTKRQEAEARMGQARAAVQELDESYRQQDAGRQEAIQAVEDMRSDLERVRLGQQEIELKARSLAEQVAEQGHHLEDLKEKTVEEIAQDIPDDAQSDDWAGQIEDLQRKIERLEPVNLAAIQEYEEESKRKEYLDAQNEDLCQALATLENAIAKIDRKTRTRFKETYEQVNKGMQELFPRLFGGGHAYLELTGEDLLTTGVGIMARPPGKRVSSIHLLSGGEKALTAVAFVFA
ncbi:MAG: chromosome segregation protein SMC, partial [Xanthomonadales bacterium]|nr:chromosome segregation protein SMC [Xanthomonadales bacterium]